MDGHKTDLILQSATGLLNSESLTTIDPKDLSDGDALFVWSLFDALDKELVSKRKKEFRIHLMELAKDHGEVNAKGSYEYLPPHSDGKVTLQCRKGKASFDEEEAAKVLKAKGVYNSVAVGTLSGSREEFSMLKKLLLGLGDAVNPGLQSFLNRIQDVEYHISDEKLEGAVMMGMVAPEDLRSASSVADPTYALVVKKPSQVVKMVKGAKK